MDSRTAFRSLRHYLSFSDEAPFPEIEQDLLSGMRAWATVAVLYVVVISGIPSAQAQSYKILFQFRAGVDGASPFGGLVSDPNGNLWDNEHRRRVRFWGGVQA
jgi:hypothetical protein